MPMIRLQPTAMPFPVARCADGRLCRCVSRSPIKAAPAPHLWSVCIKRSIVDVDRKVNGASEAHILRSCMHRRVGKEEGHRQQCPNDHGIPPSQKLQIAQVTGQDRAKDAHCIGDHVVPPGIIRTALARIRTTTREEIRQKHVEQGIRQACEPSDHCSSCRTSSLTDQRPGEPDQTGVQPQSLGRKQSSEVCQEFGEPISRLAVCRFDRSTRIELFEGERTWSVVLLGDLLKSLHDLFVLSFCQQKLGGFLQPDDGHSEDAEDKDQCSIRIPDIPPALEYTRQPGRGSEIMSALPCYWHMCKSPHPCSKTGGSKGTARQMQPPRRAPDPTSTP